MYKEDLALNNLNERPAIASFVIFDIFGVHVSVFLYGLIYHKIQQKQNHINSIYMNKEDLASSNLQVLICHKPNPTKPNQMRNICKVFHVQKTLTTGILK